MYMVCMSVHLCMYTCRPVLCLLCSQLSRSMGPKASGLRLQEAGTFQACALYTLCSVRCSAYTNVPITKVGGRVGWGWGVSNGCYKYVH